MCWYHHQPNKVYEYYVPVFTAELGNGRIGNESMNGAVRRCDILVDDGSFLTKVLLHGGGGKVTKRMVIG